MAHQTEYSRIRGYDWHHDCGCWTSFSYSSQNVGTGESAGLVSPLNTASVVPGILEGEVDSQGVDTRTYSRTDLTTLPQVVQDLLSGVWTDSFHTAYETHLRAQ